MTAVRTQYVLGSDEQEIRRLDGQAGIYAPATDILLRHAGLPAGGRVLDLGTGLGHVARLAATLVGPGGEVVGIDADERMLRVARERAAAAGLDNVRFVQADVHDFRDSERFDVVVARLLFFHLPDRDRVLRRQVDSLVPGGRVILLDFDVGTARSQPSVPLLEAALNFVVSSFVGAGADPMVGARLTVLLRDASFVDVGSLGIQPYFAPDDPRGPALIAGIVRALAAARGAACGVEPETIERRLAQELRAADAVVLPPALVATWGRRSP